MFTSLYNKVSPSCCYITVFVGDELISEGTGFAYCPAAEVLTAAHVVTGRWPIRRADHQDPNQRIFCKFPGIPVLEYRVFFCCIEIEVPGFLQRAQIDMALLAPKLPPPQSIPFLQALANPPSLGEKVFMAGYSEELQLPFQVDKLLPRDMNGVSDFIAAMKTGYMADMTGPMIKQGHVGNIRRVIAEDTQLGHKVECDFMYIDNSMHPGASGGPVFNEAGDAVGIISQRATTSVEAGESGKVYVPAGSTVAISLAPLEYVIHKTGGA